MNGSAATRQQGSTRLANEAWESMLEAHTTLMKRFVAENIWQELSIREYDVLYTLSKCPEPIRLSELQEHVLLSQPALSRMVDRLVNRRFIARETDPTDARGILLSLTEEGARIRVRIGRRHARSVARAMTAALTPNQLHQVNSLCDRLVERNRAVDDGERS